MTHEMVALIDPPLDPEQFPDVKQVWVCEECDMGTFDLTEVARHVVEHQFVVRRQA